MSDPNPMKNLAQNICLKNKMYSQVQKISAGS